MPLLSNRFEMIAMSVKKKLFPILCKKRIMGQAGAVAVLVMVLMTGIIGIMAYAIDTGSLYQTRSHLQTVADSAALAGVQELPHSPEAARQAAIAYAAMHDIQLDEDNIVIESTYSNNDTISVFALEEDKKLFFAGIFGKETSDVGARSKALIGSPASYYGVVPWGVPLQDFIPGTSVTLKTGPSGETGNFQALALNGTGSSVYKNNIINGAPVYLKLGDMILTEPGNMSGPTYEGVDSRIYNKFDNTFNSFGEITEYDDLLGGYKLAKSDSQFVICPLIDIPLGRERVEILGFAPFIITGYSGSTVTGTFLNRALIVSSGEIGAIDNTGIVAISLFE
jgi:hypothetical protein